MKIERTCCAQQVLRQSTNDIRPATQRHVSASILDLMVPLSGGTFLKGTNDAKSLPSDGEGPVRRVKLSPFRMNQTPVTNEGLASFVHSVGYHTDAERFGSSFVFRGHLSAVKNTAHETVDTAPRWCLVDGTCW